MALHLGFGEYPVKQVDNKTERKHGKRYPGPDPVITAVSGSDIFVCPPTGPHGQRQHEKPQESSEDIDSEEEHENTSWVSIYPGGNFI